MLCAAILKELGEEIEVKIYSDSTAGISANSRLGLGKMKHIEVRYLFVQGLLRRNRMSLHKVGTDDNVSDIATKPVDQQSLERHCQTMGLSGGSGGEGDHTSLMQISSGRQHGRGRGDLSRLASMVNQCGSCLVGLAMMIPKADAQPSTSDKDENDSNIFLKVATVGLVMWTALVVLATLKANERAVPTPTFTTTKGTQTDDEEFGPTIENMTVNAIRSELSRRRLPTEGRKPELVQRLTLALLPR
jgi:hypothetical protein